MRRKLLLVSTLISCLIFSVQGANNGDIQTLRNASTGIAIPIIYSLEGNEANPTTGLKETPGLSSWEYTFTQNADTDKWYWLSFPVLDTLTVKATKAYNVFKPLFHTHFTEDLEIVPTYLEGIYWREAGVTNRISWMMNDWTANHNYHVVTYPQGYKVHLMPRVSNDYPESFFLQINGYQAPARLHFPIYSGTENWIGYYLAEPQMPEKALASIWDDVLVAKTKDWCLIRSAENGEMIGKSLPLTCGEMLVMVTRNIHNFSWSRYTPVSAIRKSEPKFFVFDEKQDYIPVYVRLEKGLLGKIKEISINVRGDCKGAVVVEDSLEQISAYLDNPTELIDGDVELGFYFTGQDIDPELGYMTLEPSRLQGMYSAAGHRYPYFELKLREADLAGIVPPKFALNQNYPNPFNPATTISYQLPESGKVRLDVYNLKGQLVKTLIDGTQVSGMHSIVWNGTDTKNRSVASGVYLYRLSSLNNVQTKRMLLMK